MDNTKKLEKLITKANKENLAIIVFNDTETTGVSILDRILQSAHSVYLLNPETGDLKFSTYIEEYITPPVKINPFAATVHGIWYPDLEGAPKWEDSSSHKELTLLKEAGAYYCAHNSPFDTDMLSRENLSWPQDKVIDTLRIARHIYKADEEIESKGLQWLRYFFDFDAKDDFADLLKSYKIKRLQAHTALSDIVVLIYFFKFLFTEKKVNSLNEMLELTRTPVLEDKVTFGNVFEKGGSLKEALADSYTQYNKVKQGVEYFNWAMKNMETLSIDQKYAISFFTLENVKEGKLQITNKNISPMILTAAAFIPQHWDLLKKAGYDINKQKDMTRNSIKQKIENLLNSDNIEEQTKGNELKKSFDFMVFFADNYTEPNS